MPANPYKESTPEHRVHELAHAEPGLSDDEVLTRVGYVPHDGTLMRVDLLEQYHQAEPVARYIDGLRAHAESWSHHGMRSDLETAEAYGDHLVALHRRGEVGEWTSHKVVYPAFLAARKAEAAPEREMEAEL